MQLWAPPKKDLSRLMTSLIGAIVITYNHRLLLGVILPPTTCLIPPPHGFLQLPIILQKLDLEEYTGQGQGDGNKWTCGARLIQAPCVVYSFGSNNNMQLPGEWWLVGG